MGPIASGDKLHCTKGNWLNGNGIVNFSTPEENETVTVREVRIHEGHTLISLEEYHPDVYYPAKHFRPQYALFSDQVLKSLTVRK
jgi:hypothetical protein